MTSKKKKVALGFLAFFLCLLVGVNYINQLPVEEQSGVNEEEYTENTEKWGLDREQYNYSFQFPKDEYVVDIAEGLLNGELTVLDTMDSRPYSFDDFDWNVAFSDSPNTYQLYLQSLNPIMYLSKAYEITNKKEYLDMGKKFLEEWDKYRMSELAANNSFVWYDHGTALRADNIIYLVLTAEKADKDFFSSEEREWIYNLIKEHADFLAQEVNYTSNHNHGIFQDQALLYCAFFLNDENKDEWISIAEKRLLEQKEFAFTQEMVHVENSPTYQLGVMDLFRVVAEFLDTVGDELSATLYEDIKKAGEFMTYIMKPDGVLAEIGDANCPLDTINSLDNEHLIYAASLGTEGTKPEEKSKVYPMSGYYISRNNWDQEDAKSSTWMMFKSGYVFNTHKHADDNSFMLYSKGFDIFVDPGWYNYMAGNFYRDYFISSNAHNTVIVDGKTYSPTVENSDKVGIYDYEQNENYDYVSGFNEMYHGVSFDRHFYNLGDAIIIYDNMKSSSEHLYSQLLHASEKMKVVEETNSEVLFAIDMDGEEYFVRVQQLLDDGNNILIHGDKEKEKFGYISREMNHLDTIDTLKYDVRGKNVDIITLITIEDKNGNIEGISDIKFDEEGREFTVFKSSEESYTIKLHERERVDISAITCQKKADHTFVFTNLNEGNSYAWYVIDKKTATPVIRTEYDLAPDFEYTFETEGDYLIKAYTKSKNGRYRCSNIVAEILYDEKAKTYELKDAAGFNLVYLGHEYDKMNDNIFRFKVNFEYAWKYRVRWYIYRNGAYYESLQTENEAEIEYEFIEPGTYTVMYYLKTTNGNNEFWNFEEIEIK